MDEEEPRWPWLGRVRTLARAALALVVVSGCRVGDRNDVRAFLDQSIAGRIGRPGLAYDIVYRMYVPPSHDASRKYPVLLFLHGSGALGNDNQRQIAPELASLNVQLQKREPVFVLAPQCPSGAKWITGAMQSGPYLNYSQRDRPESDAIKLVLLLLDELAQKYPLDADRIYVSGHSSGAAGTWDIISRRANDRFAAAVPVTGVNDPSRAPAIANLPLWVFHGAKDETSPVRNAREMVGALRAVGSSVRYTEYPDMGHDTLHRAYHEPELVPWLLAQRRGTR